MSTTYDLYRDAELYLAENNPRRAVAVLDEALALEPGEPNLERLLARALLAFGSVGRAEALLRDIVDRSPCDAYATDLLARTLHRQSKHEEARRFETLAALLAPPSPDDA